MIDKIKQLLGENKQFKNFSTLAIGSVLSQVFLVIVSPLLTRIFSPTDFGFLSTFTSVSVLLSIVFSGRYELAIGLPEKNQKAFSILRLLLRLSILTSALLLIFILVFYGLETAGVIKGFFSIVYFLLPFYVFLVINNSALLYWANREKKYSNVSISNLILVIINIIISVILGLLGVKNLGMIIGLIIGMFFSVLYLYNSVLERKNYNNTDDVKMIAKEYSHFPRFTLFSDLGVNLNQQFLPIVFLNFYSAHIVGLFSLANRMLRLPNIVFTSAISNVFRNEAIDLFRENGNCKSLYISILKKLVFIGLIIYSLIFLSSPYLFKLFFGEQWTESGFFAQILCVMLFFEFFSQPFNSLFYIRNEQKKILGLQSFQTFLSIGVVVVLSILKMEPYLILIAYSIISILFSVIFLYFTRRIAYNSNGK